MTFLSAIPKIVVSLVIAGLLASTVFYRWQSEKKDAALIANQATITAQQGSIDRQRQTIQHMIEFRKSDQTAFAQLLANQAKILSQANITTLAIAKLRKNDAQVDKYLSEPIPVPLRNIINGLSNSAKADCRNKDNRCDAAKAVN